MSSRFSQRLESLGFKSYDDYLSGDHWQQFRQRFRQSNLPQACRVCNTAKSIDLHHINYDNLGQETFADIMPLCREHHTKVHEVLKERKWHVGKSGKVVKFLAGGGLPQDKPVIIQNIKKKKAKQQKIDGQDCPRCHKSLRPHHYKEMMDNTPVGGIMHCGCIVKKSKLRIACPNCKRPMRVRAFNDMLRCRTEGQPVHCAHCPTKKTKKLPPARTYKAKVKAIHVKKYVWHGPKESDMTTWQKYLAEIRNRKPATCQTVNSSLQ